jgi:hypothetical protein
MKVLIRKLAVADSDGLKQFTTPGLELQILFAQISTSACQSRPFRAKREASIETGAPMTAQITANSFSKPRRDTGSRPAEIIISGALEDP